MEIRIERKATPRKVGVKDLIVFTNGKIGMVISDTKEYTNINTITTLYSLLDMDSGEIMNDMWHTSIEDLIKEVQLDVSRVIPEEQCVLSLLEGE